MQIAYVTETYPPELNGVALTVERTVRHLRERGHALCLIRPRQPGEPPRSDNDEHRSAGCAIPMYPDLRMGLALPALIARRLRAANAELVHVATPGPLGWAAVSAARGLGLAITSDFRTHFQRYAAYYGLGPIEPLARGYLRRLHNRSHCTFVPTREVAVELQRAGFERLHLSGRGVDAGRFTPAARSEALRRAWRADAAPVLLCVGRLAAEKNVALALQAFEALRAQQPAARMVVVGDGPQRARLQARFPDVHFAGVQRGAALATHYASADLFLFPSLTDTFGNVVLEALASGLPVIAFDTGAAAEHVVDGRSGRLVQPGDAAAFVAAALAFAQQPMTMQAARAPARATALALDWAGVLARFERQLDITLNAHRHAPADIALV